MIRPTPAQRAEMAAYIDTTEPGLLDDLGIERVIEMCPRGHGQLENGDCPDCSYST